MTDFHPGGASVVLLKLNVPYSAVYADIIGLRLYCLNKFKANMHCLTRRQNKCIGTFLSVLQSPGMK